jgi:hypothetical protein
MVRVHYWYVPWYYRWCQRYTTLILLPACPFVHHSARCCSRSTSEAMTAPVPNGAGSGSGNNRYDGTYTCTYHYTWTEHVHLRFGGRGGGGGYHPYAINPPHQPTPSSAALTTHPRWSRPHCNRAQWTIGCAAHGYCSSPTPPHLPLPAAPASPRPPTA